jgi:hypothetical protein
MQGSSSQIITVKFDVLGRRSKVISRYGLAIPFLEREDVYRGELVGEKRHLNLA